MLVKVLVINVADSIFDVDLLIPLLNDMTSAAEKETVPITHRLLGLEDFWFQKWNWHVKIAHVGPNRIPSFSDNYYDIYGRFSNWY